MRRTSRPLIGIAALALAAGMFAYGASAFGDTFSEAGGVPRLVPFRAHIEQSGVPVTSALTLTFALYDQPSGGALLWGPEAHTLTPANGEISVMLGQTERLSPSVLERGDAYVQVSIGATVLGRQRLGSVPYALRAANGVPPGTIIAFGGTEVPDGWIVCDGRALDRDEPAFASLFAALGTTWGDGSSGAGASAATDFNAPDLRGRFARGVDPREVAERLNPEVPGEVGHYQGWGTGLPRAGFSTSSAGNHNHGGILGGTYWGSHNAGTHSPNPADTAPVPFDGAHTHTVVGGDIETRPLSAAVHYVIKL